MPGKRELGLERGRIFPARRAHWLLNPLRHLVQPVGRTVAYLELAPGLRVLEVGPGPGYFTPALLRRIEGGELHLLDIQAEMLKLAVSRGGRGGGAVIAAVQGDAMSLPYRGEDFDLAFLVSVLGEVPEPVVCLAELHRVLKPGGFLAITETRGDPDRIAPGRLRALAEGAGFEFGGKRGWLWSYTARFRKPRGP